MQLLRQKYWENHPSNRNIIKNLKHISCMKPIRKTSLVFGLFFAGTFIFSIPALFFYEPLISDNNYLFLGGFDMRISMGALF